VVGRSRGAATKRAVAWLRSNQNDDGGFGQFKGRSSNAQSTSYAIQGLVAAGAGGATLPRSIGYLKRLQRADGSIAYSSSSSQTPVWVTAQALMALERKPLPLGAVPRRKPPKREPEAQASAARPQPAAPVSPPPPASEPASPAGAEQPATPTPDRSQPIVPSMGVDEPPVDEPSASARPGDGLRLDPAEGKGADSSGDGGPALWLVAVLLGGVALALFLIRRRVPRPTRWLPRAAAGRMRPPTERP
jgi:Squalene-hopene cyclase C-terminal domain